ncbi:MAG: pirin family protein [Steroidobacteraceae bacterium]|jgi:redox-sensitive bicupin YhaK (pirin superfamily)|nr:pirin family protein [Steroidobacteraceae bacterium]
MAVIDTLVGRARDLGDGFQVRRVLPHGRRQMVGPFVFFDQMGPVQLAPGGGLDVRPHPHVGLATVTYLFDGVIRHRDSLGVRQDIRPGDVNWMTAGRGIVHSERTPEEMRAAGSSVSGIQSWVALPRAHEDAEPAFVHHAAATLPCFTRDGAELCVIAGEAYGRTAPVRTFSTLFYVDASLTAGGGLDVPAGYEERAVYVAEGEASVDGVECRVGDLALLGPGIPAAVTTRTGARVMLLGGEPLDGPRHVWWNFVASSPERLAAAREAWRRYGAAPFSRVPDDDEFMPLPEQ